MSDPNGRDFIRSASVGFGPASGELGGTQKLRLLVIGDFGAQSMTGMRLAGDVPATLPEQVGVLVEGKVANLLASNPAQIDVSLPIRRWAEFGPRHLLTAIDTVRQARSVRDSLAAGRVPTLPPTLDRLEPWIEPPAAKPPAAARPAAGDEADLDRLMSMFSTDADATRPGPETAAGTSVPAPNATLKQRVAGIDALIEAQLGAIRTMPRFAALDAAWRGLRLLTRRPGYGEGITVDILSVPANQGVATLLTDVVPDELEQRGSGLGLSCVLVLGGFAPDEDGLRDLGFCAASGEALGVPVIASLRQDFTTHPDADRMLAALAGIPGADYLAACSGDLVLEAADRPEPLWGEPGWAVAALALAALARTGDLRRIADASSVTLVGLDVHELPSRSGPVAWPLRVAPGPALPGIIALAAQPNWDHVFLPAAQTVGGRALGELLAG